MLSLIDWVILIAYFLAMIYIGIKYGKKETLSGFYVNDRKTSRWKLIFSIVATSVGMITVVGGSAEAYRTGISFAVTGFIAIVAAFLFAGWLVPRIKKFGDTYNAYTMGDFYNLRYSPANRNLVGIIILISYIVILAAQMVGVASLAQVFFGLDFYIGLILSILITISYTAFAGLRSDIFTDFIQFWIILLSLVGVFIIILFKYDGFQLLSSLDARYFDIFAFGGPEFFFAGLILTAPLFLIAMDFWQRVYASEAKKGLRKTMVISAAFNAPLFLIPCILGLFAVVLYPGLLSGDLALFQLLNENLPPFFLGLGIAGLLAAAMSTLDSLLMVGSTTFVHDFYKNSGFYKEKNEKKELKAARLLVVVYGLIGLIVAFFIPDVLRLGLIANFILLVLAPSIIAGFVWKRANAKASFWSILIGFLVTVALLPFLPKLAFIPGFLVSLIVFVVLSYTGEHAMTEKVALVD